MFIYTHKTDNYDPPTKQTLQYLQGGAGPGVPAGVLHEARGAARDGAGRNAWETGELTRMIDLPYFPNICCPIRITVTEQRIDSEILDAGEREHEEMIGTQLSIIR